MTERSTYPLADLVDVLDYMRRPVNSTERQQRLGNVPYFGATGQAGWIDEALFNETLVLLGEDAIDFGNHDATKAYLIHGPSWVNNHAHVLRARASMVLPEFLTYALNQVDYADFASFGTRSKLTQSNMRRIRLAIPEMAEQRRIVDLVGALDRQVKAMEAERVAAWALLTALRQDSLASGKRLPLAQVCSIESMLVDPREADYSGLPHIGIEAIAKATGRVSALRTAKEDGLISAKYLYSDADVIFAKIRPNLRKVALPGGRGLCSADAYPLRAVPGLPASLLRETLLLDSVVHAVVASSGRTKMPKVNRRELFAVEVPLGEPDRWQQLAGPLDAVRSLAEKVENEVDALRCMRSDLLMNLVSGVTTLTQSYEPPQELV